MSDPGLGMWNRDDLAEMVMEQRRTIDALYANKRDKFAMAAMQAMLTRSGDWHHAALARIAYNVADEMLKAREATNDPAA